MFDFIREVMFRHSAFPVRHRVIVTTGLLMTVMLTTEDHAIITSLAVCHNIDKNFTTLKDMRDGVVINT